MTKPAPLKQQRLQHQGCSLWAGPSSQPMQGAARPLAPKQRSQPTPAPNSARYRGVLHTEASGIDTSRPLCETKSAFLDVWKLIWMVIQSPPMTPLSSIQQRPSSAGLLARLRAQAAWSFQQWSHAALRPNGAPYPARAADRGAPPARQRHACLSDRWSQQQRCHKRRRGPSESDAPKFTRYLCAKVHRQ